MNRVPKCPLKQWVKQKIGRVCVHGVLYVGHIKMVSTLEALVSGHPQDAKKVSSVTGAGRLRELKNTEFVLVCYTAVFSVDTKNGCVAD